MPELPDLTIYIEALEARLLDKQITQIRRTSPFFVRTVEPPLTEAHGRRVIELRRIGKRIAIGLEDEFWIVIHLMIAGRFQWKSPDAPIPKRIGLATIDSEDGTLIITEAGSKKRASLHFIQGDTALDEPTTVAESAEPRQTSSTDVILTTPPACPSTAR